MRSPETVKRLSVVLLIMTITAIAVAQPGRGDSWEEVFRNNKGIEEESGISLNTATLAIPQPLFEQI